MNRSRDIIKILNELDLKENNAYDNVISLFENGEIEIPYLTYKVQKGIIVFRSRENELTSFFTSIDELSCPRSHQVKYYNRANRPFQSVFYCSDKRESSYSEFMEKWAEYKHGTTFSITIGMWRIIKDLNLILISNQEMPARKINQIKGSPWTQDNEVLNEFLTAKFVQQAYYDKSVYILTSAIANTLVLKSKCDGIMYPCIPTNGNGFNFAIKKDIYENGGVKLEAVLRETFKTTNNKKSDKPIHISTGIKEGRINQSRKSIDW